MSFIALASLQLLLMIIGVCSHSDDIGCLRSIKESLEDPLDMLSSWRFDNPGKTEKFTCSFRGISCWRSETSEIVSIDLSGMGLKGEFPRGISNCSALQDLDLSINHLYGSIPWDISRLFVYAVSLDLSNNSLSGEIPPDIANFSYLNTLKLDTNLLTGRIPAQMSFLRRLVVFSVSNNQLSGPVPVFPNALIPPESYVYNKGLCGYPLDPCEARSDLEYLFLGGGFFAGLVFFFPVSLIVGLFTSFWEFFFKFIKTRAMSTPRLHSGMRSMDDNPTNMHLEKFATRMSFLELSQATDQFSENNVIAAGETGTMYKALTLWNGFFQMAIKRLTSSTANPHAFRSEITMLGRFRHRNLVPLLGFCHESNHRLLVYKLMTNGSLHDCLFPPSGKAGITDWPVRARIAVGLANGIAWLHQNRVVHRGISSKCVLLDENFEPKISGFRNAIAPNEQLFAVVDPYEQDVHGFGTVLLELITGKRYDEIISSFDIDADITSEQMFGLLNVPEALTEQGFGDEISGFLSIAARCVECDPGNWPSMEQVCEMLISKRKLCDAVDESSSSSKENEIEFAS